MSKYRNHLPQLSQDTFITDGGLETTLVFDHGYNLPEFAAFDLFKHAEGYHVLQDYFTRYTDIALAHKVGFILESPTWRASRDWGAKIGYSPKDLKHVNRISIGLLDDIRRRKENGRTKIVVSGCIGPRGDGYCVERKMDPETARRYHLEQVRILSETEADLVSALTINYVEEAIGITRAAQEVGIPVAISFTVETDGRLPSGQSLEDAIMAVDDATGDGPAYYMINCAHPTHFTGSLKKRSAAWKRIKAIRANASSKSHAELDEAVALDAGDPDELGQQYGRLRQLLPQLNIFGGCCGTDHRHVTAICREVVGHA